MTPAATRPRRWPAPAAAALVAALLVVPTWLAAATTQAPAAQPAPPARTQPTATLAPRTEAMGPSVWCVGDLGCRPLTGEDRAITAWALTTLVEPALTPTATPTATPAGAPGCAPAAAVTGLAALVTPGCAAAAAGLVDLEVYPLAGGPRAHAEARDGVPVGPGAPAQAFQLPDLPPGAYVLKVGVFSPGWGVLYGWNDDAARLTVAAPAPTATATATAAASPTMISTATATITATPPVATASPTPAPPSVTPTAAAPPGPRATVVCLTAEYRDGVLTCAPAAESGGS